LVLSARTRRRQKPNFAVQLSQRGASLSGTQRSPESVRCSELGDGGGWLR
jgi:hypothetical protein